MFTGTLFHNKKTNGSPIFQIEDQIRRMINSEYIKTKFYNKKTNVVLSVATWESFVTGVR
jgi:hypothetical protein